MAGAVGPGDITRFYSSSYAQLAYIRIFIHSSIPRITHTRWCVSISETSILGHPLRSAAKGFGSRRVEPISGHARKQGAYSLTNNLTLLDFSVACNQISRPASSPAFMSLLIGLWRYHSATVTPVQTTWTTVSRDNMDCCNTRRQ